MPGAPIVRMSLEAPSDVASAAATVSALMLSTVPFSSADSGLTIGTIPFSSWARTTSVSTLSMSPTKPKSTGPPAWPSTWTGGRLWALMRPASTPLMPTAGRCRSRQAARIRVLTVPFSTMVVTSRVCLSVTRRPPTIRVGTPSALASSVDWGPPPCTSTTRMPTWCSSATCSSRCRVASSEVKTSPPALRTKIFFL